MTTRLQCVLASFASVLLVNCVTDDASFGEMQSEATNKPHKNGCDATKSVRTCASQKGVLPIVACAFRKRADGAYFAVGYKTDVDEDWQLEARIPFILDRVCRGGKCVNTIDLTLADACDNGATYSTSSTPESTLIPTQKGCAKLAGKWTGKYCTDH